MLDKIASKMLDKRKIVLFLHKAQQGFPVFLPQKRIKLSLTVSREPMERSVMTQLKKI